MENVSELTLTPALISHVGCGVQSLGVTLAQKGYKVHVFGFISTNLT